MQVRALGLALLVALFVVAGKPQAQPVADDPVVPMPIAQDDVPATEITLASTNPPAGGSMVMGNVESKVPPPASQPANSKVGQSGTIQLPSTARQVCYLFQMEDGMPASVVLWRAVGEGAKFDPAEVRERISLQHPQALSGKSVYALQTDYNVQKVSLSAQDAAHIMDLVQSNADGKILANDATWKAKVIRSLEEVEYDPQRSKELRKLAAQRAREAKKARSNSLQKNQDAKPAAPAKPKPKSAKSAPAAHRSHAVTASVKVRHSTHTARVILAHR